MSSEAAKKHYENLLIIHDPNSQNLMKGLEIVKKYIIREKLILTGGMAIDFALRLHKKKLYDDDAIPDYDFITPHHWIDAYEIAQWLSRIGMKEISVINAMHPTTMKIRLNFVGIADITYNPENIFKNIPQLNYHGFNFVHPHYQFIDQHRALSMGYEKLEMGWPVAPDRWKKDMTRYDILWAEYPLTWTGEGNIELDIEKTITKEILNNQCITGFLALQYWICWAKEKGFKTSWNLGKYETTKTGATYVIPIDSHGCTLYTNDINELYKKIHSKYKIKDERFYNRFLDKLPRKVIMDNQWELLDNKNTWIAAHKVDGFHVANLQPIMMYLLANYIILNKIIKEDRGYPFYAGYMVCRELLQFGADNAIPELLPTAEYYGTDNFSEAYMLAAMKFDKSNRQNNDSTEAIPLQPHHVYDRDMAHKKVPNIYYKFKPSESILFAMDGERCKSFLGKN